MQETRNNLQNINPRNIKIYQVLIIKGNNKN